MAAVKTGMRTTHSRLLARVLPFVLLVPLVVAPITAYLVLSDSGRGQRLPVAQGAAGGTFHPVAGDFVADDTVLGDCAGSYSCLEQAFGNIAFRHGPKRALALFDSRVGVDADVERDCHRIVHTIGSATFARYDGDVAKTFAEGSSTCASGYYHGILERAFVGVESKAELREVARTLCDGVGIRRHGFLDYQCRHGLGHGFMIQTGYDLPTALALCSSLGTGWDEITCTSGTFMENVSTRFGFRSPWLEEEEPLYPCTRVQQRHRRSCYVRSTTWALEVNGNDFGKTARLCKSAGARWAPFCFRGLGRDAVVENRYADLGGVHRLCGLAGGFRGDCLYGAARTFSDGAALDGVRRAARFCSQRPSAERQRASLDSGSSSAFSTRLLNGAERPALGSPGRRSPPALRQRRQRSIRVVEAPGDSRR